MGNHIGGKKISKSHSTMIDVSIDLVKMLNKHPDVKKITLGIITPGLRSSQKRLKVITIKGGIKATVKGTCSMQEIYIYTDQAQAVEKSLFTSFNN